MYFLAMDTTRRRLASTSACAARSALGLSAGHLFERPPHCCGCLLQLLRQTGPPGSGLAQLPPRALRGVPVSRVCVVGWRSRRSMTSISRCAASTVAAEAVNPAMRSRRVASLNAMRRISRATRACARRTFHWARRAMR